MQKNIVSQAWQAVLQPLVQWMQAVGSDAARTVVLLPYAQLLPVARQQWLVMQGNGIMPRFETTADWAARLQPFVPGANDFVADTAVSLLTARRLLSQVGVDAADGARLADRVLEAATQLAPIAAAYPPAQRVAWMTEKQQQIDANLLGDAAEEAARSKHPLSFEAVVAKVALAWVGTSQYATDVLWQVVQNQQIDALALVQGYRSDALAQQLAQAWQQLGHTVYQAPLPAQWPLRSATAQQVRWHQAHDLEDQVLRAATCVQQSVEQQQGMVALVDTDRALTRRIRAILEQQHLTIRDETGWKLSTTRAASWVLAVLRSAQWQVDSDVVLDWLHQSTALADGAELQALPALEALLRKNNQMHWPSSNFWVAAPEAVQILAQQVDVCRQALQAQRSPMQWLAALQTSMQQTHVWSWMQSDVAGAALLQALHMLPHHSPIVDVADWSLQEFTRWVQAVLEAGSFKPPYPMQEQVVIVPLSQLLARDFAAVVIPGCDTQRLPAVPEPAGNWTRAQREILGLPGHEDGQAAQKAAWHYALQLPQVDVLHSHGDGTGNVLLPSQLVLEWKLLHGVDMAPDVRSWKALTEAPVSMPAPAAQGLPLPNISASSYGSLRNCPYQFYARYLLGLAQVQELSSAVDKRVFGNFLHKMLERLHCGLRDAGLRISQIDDAQLEQRMQLAKNEALAYYQLDAADFVPWAAMWPLLSQGYVAWAKAHDAVGWEFAKAEDYIARRLSEVYVPDALNQGQPVPDVVLQGYIDRMDIGQDGVRMLIDYKSENLEKTRGRISDPYEDTQLAFYAALQAPHDVQVAYVNIGEKGDTTALPAPNVLAMRDTVLQGIATEMAAILQGSPLPALGEGQACDYCSARGLCRKDFWGEQ